MKKILITTIAILGVSSITFAQSIERLKNFHGIIQNEVHFYEGEGYDISVQKIEAGLNEKGLKKIKKRYNIKECEFTADSIVNHINRVLIKTEERGKIKIYSTFYLLPESEKITTVFVFARAIPRDKFLEQYFINIFLEDKIPYTIYTIPEVHTIDFVGRDLDLGPICRWMSPHNIQCPNYGQMNWAIFEDSTKAVANLNAQYEINKSKSIVTFLAEEWINIKFEGVNTKAKRTKIKIKVPKLLMGGSNILIAYYVNCKVRGKYVTCVLSHYSDDINASMLPPLLAEVMELSE